jgi:hypothetical protein
MGRTDVGSIKNTRTEKFPTYEGGFKIYEDGKHRRYELLFAVNGGAFVIAKLFAEKDIEPDRLGFLSPGLIAGAMIVYTFIMWWDIYTFGDRMHVQLDGPKTPQKTSQFTTFGPTGRWILALLCAMLIAAWGLLLLKQDLVAPAWPGCGIAVGIVAFAGVLRWKAKARPEGACMGCGDAPGAGTGPAQVNVADLPKD